MTRKKQNITPELIGEFYTDGEEVYRLVGCESEPHATMSELLTPLEPVVKPISQFAAFVRLKPERPITKPAAPRKRRSDAGTTREKPKVEQASISGEPETSISQVEEPEQVSTPPMDDVPQVWKPDISTFKVKTGLEGGKSRVYLGPNTIWCDTLRDGVLQLLTEAGIDQKFVEDAPDSNGKRDLLTILKRRMKNG